MEGLDPKIISEILESNAKYTDEEEEATCRRMVHELSESEQEVAARTSYTYYVASTTMGCADDDIRTRFAMREARRHLVGEGGDYQSAMDNLRATCDFRKEYKIDLLRCCFSDLGGGDDSDADREMHRNLILKDLNEQLMAVRGHDRQKRAILLKMGRTSTNFDEDAYFHTQLYMAERAAACTEVLSRGQEEHFLAVFDFGNYSSAYSPPLSTVRKTVKTLQRHYPERLAKLCILDPPFWMRSLYTVIHPFLAEKTQAKVIMVSNDASKSDHIGSLVDAEQAMPFMHPDGKLDPTIDVRHMLHCVPFHHLYDADMVDKKESIK